MDSGLHVMIYDRTCAGERGRPGLAHSWWLGARLYRRMRRFDEFRGAACWDEALRWLAAVEPGREIAEIQFWGHGKWGSVSFAGERLSIESLEEDHLHHGPLLRVRRRMAKNALWWFRSCETFGAVPGQEFARAWTRWWGCRAAGHTHIIGPLQSGLHSLAPGDEPHWSPLEGLLKGSPEAPERARRSSPRAPNTITCLHGHLPGKY